MFVEIFQVVPTLGVIDWTPIVSNIVLSIAGVVFAVVGKAVRDFTIANKENKNFALLTSIAEAAVQAVEQVYGENEGDTKKAAAIEAVEAALATRGLKIDLDEIVNAIEAAVLREFNFSTAVDPTPSETISIADSTSPAENLN